jgi:hypothetical protein
MPITITNKADYLLILQLNDGQSVYLPPGESSSAIDEGQLSGNEKYAKLERENIIAVAAGEADKPAAGDGPAAAGPPAAAASSPAKPTAPAGGGGGPKDAEES